MKAAKTMLMSNPRAARAVVGVANRDITPPVGIYARQWGAATHDQAQGVHRPLFLQSLVIRPIEGGDPLVLIAGDLTWFRLQSDMAHLREPLIEKLGLDPANIMLSCSHTHAACSLCSAEGDMPGGEMIGEYFDTLRETIYEATRQALDEATPATITTATGRCALATNRDFKDPDADRFICGFNPEAAADDTLMVARITRDDTGAVLATIVNYACHPTTLAWDNDRLSPDYVGAMRALVEAHTGGAPCVFLQGASGELAPADQYTGDREIADAGGRYLGYAAITALESMLPPKRGLGFEGVVESGAPLAVWRQRTFEPSTVITAERFDVPLLLRPELPTVAEFERDYAAAEDRTIKERFRRKLFNRRELGDGPTVPVAANVWRIGDMVLVGQP